MRRGVIDSAEYPLRSFHAWRVHAVKQQLARSSTVLITMQLLMYAFFVLFPSIYSFPRDLHGLVVDLNDPVSSFWILIVGSLTSCATCFMASPWIRRRPEESFDMWLNIAMFLEVFVVDVWPLFFDAETRAGYKSTHVVDALWPAAVLSMVDMQSGCHHVLMVLHGLVWTTFHFWICNFELEEAMLTTVPVVTVFVLLTISSRGRMGTLRDCFEIHLLKQEAEDGYKRFLSYMMHEMRNPIGGAMYLLDDLEHSTRQQAATGTISQRQTGRRNTARTYTLKESDSGVPPPPRGGETTSQLSFPLQKRGEVSVGGGSESRGAGDSSSSCGNGGICEGSGAQSARGLEMAFLQRKIRASLEAMKAVCDDVLTLEKVQQRGFEYLVTSCDPIVWMRGLSDLEKISMNTENVKFNVDVEVAEDLCLSFESKALAVAADWIHLRQVAVNFLSNARKFTKAEGVVVLRFQVERLIPSALPQECTLTETPTPQGQSSSAKKSPCRTCCDVVRSSTGLPDPSDVFGWVRITFSVTDTGAGLTATDKENLFLPYSQIRAGELQRGGGSGLGLCISKMFVEAHWGGRVGAESDGPGTGSTFHFSMYAPLVALLKAKRRGSPASLFPFSSFASGQTLQYRNSQPTAVGFDDLSPASLCLGERLLPEGERDSEEEGEGTKNPNDTRKSKVAHEPSISVFATPFRSPRRLQQSARIAGGVLEKTGLGDSNENVSPKEREDSRVSVRGKGAQRPHSSSPTQNGKLNEKRKDATSAPSGSRRHVRSNLQIAASCKGHDLVSAPALPEPELVPAGMPPQMMEQVRAFAGDFDCLVVDDLWICAFGAFRTMERLGFRPWMCLSGERALEVVEMGGAAERVRVVLMDKDMPGIDGPETIRRLKKFFGDKEVGLPTIIGITGEVAGPGMAALRDAGADAVLPKPCRPEALHAELKRLNALPVCQEAIAKDDGAP
uniref:histidine kinase n=1 Tax=Chromera velia CCMP2878 TaxID=1169474 RepID=A0A0G4I941_9ALVE|eukprot:Cvel_12109.t1-p1 / transcript=Cvel_12109.t1 / gene=Cvel_12109 / organism=Chromera_velia_CCMP2878 / gene_product=hypothetical protein / transcript_product=hypothetical protein / location=Cvel_scaffold780:17354-21423(+) / protein_length=954 / sequence_SO=supercontig / SO=protein_coding / is_pseudo=false